MQRINLAGTLRSHLGTTLGRGGAAPTDPSTPRRRLRLAARLADVRLTKRATAPTYPEISAVAPKRRVRRVVGLAVAATLMALPVSVGVQSVTAPKAQAAVNDNNSWLTSTVALAVFNYWRSTQHWPSAGTSNSVYYTGAGYANGGGTYNDYDRQLRNWIGNQTGNWGTLHFREYDDTARPTANTLRNAGRYVYNVEYGVIFHTVDHYANFSPLNFGAITPPWFRQTVYCYEYSGTGNSRRIALRNGHSSAVPYTVNGLPASGMSVYYDVYTEYWDPQGYYYQTPGSTSHRTGYSYTAYNAFLAHSNASAICRQWTGWNYGTF